MDRKDVVCGMQVDPNKPHEHSVVDAITYHFCSLKCNHTFENDPAFFVKREMPSNA